MQLELLLFTALEWLVGLLLTAFKIPAVTGFDQTIRPDSRTVESRVETASMIGHCGFESNRTYKKLTVLLLFPSHLSLFGFLESQLVTTF
jgi:hypothetical protein